MQRVPATSEPAWPDAGALDYGAYFDLALPADQGHQRSEAALDAAKDHLIGRISSLSATEPADTVISVNTLSDRYYSSWEIDRLTRWWDAEPDNAFGLTPVSDEELSLARNWIETSFDMLAKADPDLHREILALIRQIVVARPDGGERTSFGASSSFALWGSMVVDYVSNDCWPLMYRTIVHEAAHNLLFAIARNEPLVENYSDERYPSPVRQDLRPMDGIFHAAFVSARESLALDRLLCWQEKTGALDATEAQLIFKLLEISVINFWKCAGTLNEHGKLTELGKAVLADCETFMNENFALKPA